MATLNNETLRKRKKRKFLVYMVMLIILIIFSPLVVEGLNGILNGVLKDFGNFNFNFQYGYCLELLVVEPQRKMLMMVFLLLTIGFFIITESIAAPPITGTNTIKVTENIEIPVSVGNGQYGNAKFKSKKELDKTFGKITYRGDGKITGLCPDAALIVHFEKNRKEETLWYMKRSNHVILLGATGIGKTRRVLLPSIWLDIKAGVNMCITDAKGEIYAYTSTFAKQNNYRIITMDLRTPEKSMHHNYMIDVNELLKEGDISEAVDKAWDLVSILVGEAKGEKIWNNGECATIAAAILIVAQDAPEECKNLPNVYYFLAYMCETNELGEMPINDFLNSLPKNHPARAAFQVAKIAPLRTRSSFFTSALATLRHFTNYKIAEMTSKSDYSMLDIDNQKTIIYLMVPDEKTTLYGLGSLYINQLYINLVETANKQGGKLQHKFIFRCDEFGNFPVIPGMGPKLSAARSRNIFFELTIQDYTQLESKYKDDFGNIKANSNMTMFLNTTDSRTLRELSDRCGTYTVQINSTSSSNGEGRNKINYSANANMTSRPLLFPADIEKIQPPDTLLLMAGEQPAITNLPDLTAYYANEELGLGDEAYNQKIYMQRHAERVSRKVSEPLVWDIWNEFQPMDSEVEISDKKVSFL